VEPVPSSDRIDAGQAFTDMLTTEYTLRTGTPEQKQQSLAYLAQYYGVPLPTAGAAILRSLTLHHAIAPDGSGLQQQLRQMNEQRVVQERERAQAEFDALGQAKDDKWSGEIPALRAGQADHDPTGCVRAGRYLGYCYTASQFVSMTNCTSKPWKPNAHPRCGGSGEAAPEAVEKAKKGTARQVVRWFAQGRRAVEGTRRSYLCAMERAGFSDWLVPHTKGAIHGLP
jgi:hypothetical protein